MDEQALRRLLDDVREGTLGADEAVRRLRAPPFADLGFARVDHHRVLRQSMVEAVYGPGKSTSQCVAIVGELLCGAEDEPGPVLLTRADADQVATVLDAHPAGVLHGDRTVVWRPAPRRDETVVVLTGGTGDLPVADECVATVDAHGFRTDLLVDVGVAGLHRLLRDVDRLAEADAVVVIAGMEGALASVVGGLTSAPVVAVPTSVGYGASLDGVTAMLAMLASCAPGLCVVGIDNGFGAGCAVKRMLGPPGHAQTAGRDRRV